MDKLGIIGLGKWGSALRFAAKKSDAAVICWSRTARDLDGFCPLEEVMEVKFMVVGLNGLLIKVQVELLLLHLVVVVLLVLLLLYVLDHILGME